MLIHGVFLLLFIAIPGCYSHFYLTPLTSSVSPSDACYTYLNSETSYGCTGPRTFYGSSFNRTIPDEKFLSFPIVETTKELSVSMTIRPTDACGTSPTFSFFVVSYQNYSASLTFFQDFPSKSFGYTDTSHDHIILWRRKPTSLCLSRPQWISIHLGYPRSISSFFPLIFTF